MLRRILAGILAAVFCGSLTACGTNSIANDGKLTVVATNFALYDFARAVCGDTCDVRMLLAPGSESHDFEATLADIALIAETDVFVYVGILYLCQKACRGLQYELRLQKQDTAVLRYVRF